MGLDNPLHIAFLLVIVLLVFGAKRLPEMGKSLGSGMRGFKDAISGESPAVALAKTSADHEEPAPAHAPEQVAAYQAPGQQVAAYQAPGQQVAA